MAYIYIAAVDTPGFFASCIRRFLKQRYANDSHCMLNLRSKTLAIVEKDTGRAVRCNIEGYPYVLIWSKAETPYRFVCIEPWQSLPGEENGSLNWEERPCAAALHPGESWSTTLCTTFDR